MWAITVLKQAACFEQRTFILLFFKNVTVLVWEELCLLSFKSYHQKLSGKENIKNNDSVKKKSEETPKRFVFYFFNLCVTLQGFQ